MELIYRGLSLGMPPAGADVPLSRQFETAIYRGHFYSCPLSESAQIPQTALALTYRGIPCPTGSVKRTTDPSVQAVPPRSGIIFHPQFVTTQVTELHRRNIEKRLQDRIRSAQSRGDQALIRLLEAELQQIA